MDSPFTLNSGQRKKFAKKKFCRKLQYPLDSDLSYGIDSVMYCSKNEQEGITTRAGLL